MLLFYGKSILEKLSNLEEKKISVKITGSVPKH
jgi:hypothetical protein